MKEYQPNSHRSKELQATELPTERKVEKVVNGKAKTRENKNRRFADIFISEDAANVKSYIFMDVLVPAIKKAVSDIVTDGIDMILYGGTGGSDGRSRRKSSDKISYRSYYDSRRDGHQDGPRSRFEYDDIVFETRGEAEAVRREMLEVIDRYGFVTVADMYDMADLTAPYTSNNYGWVNIRNAEPVRVKGGYVLKLPKASPIE